MFILSQHLTAVDVPPLIKLLLKSIVLSKHISFLIPMQETKSFDKETLGEGSSVTSCESLNGLTTSRKNLENSCQSVGVSVNAFKHMSIDAHLPDGIFH